MVWVELPILVIALVAAFWWLAKRSDEADDELRSMNKGRTNGPGIFGIFDKDHRR